MTKIISLTSVNLVIPKAGANHELLFIKLVIEFQSLKDPRHQCTAWQCMQTLHGNPCKHCRQCMHSLHDNACTHCMAMHANTEWQSMQTLQAMHSLTAWQCMHSLHGNACTHCMAMHALIAWQFMHSLHGTKSSALTKGPCIF